MIDVIIDRVFGDADSFSIGVFLLSCWAVYHVAIIKVKITSLSCEKHDKKLEDLRSDITDIKIDIASIKK